MSDRSETRVRCAAPATPGIKIAGRRWEKLDAYLCRRMEQGMEKKGVEACISCKTQDQWGFLLQVVSQTDLKYVFLGGFLSF